MIDNGSCDDTLGSADILSNLESKVLHLEPSQQCIHLVSNHACL